MIDEAQDLFSSTSSHFKAMVNEALAPAVRKGRSRFICLVFGVQAASAVPEEIAQNLNTQIIMRHNNMELARLASSRASKEQLALTDTFGPGEALVYLWGASGIVHCQMRRSPFRLDKIGG